MGRSCRGTLMCLLDSDVYRDLQRPITRSNPSRVDVGVVHALRRLYRDVSILPVGNLDTAFEAIARHRPQLVFNLAYSGTAEESGFAARLEACGIPVTGSPAKALALTNDKARTRRELKKYGVRVPRWVELPVGKRRSLSALHPPLLVKPSRYAGSSYGVYADSVVLSETEAMKRAGRLWERFGEPVVCDEFIVGREFRVGAIEVAATGKFSAVNVTESLFPRAKNGWGLKTQSIRGRDLARRAQNVGTVLVASRRREHWELRALACQVARACGLRGYFTIDVRTDRHGRHFVVDVNANPGLSVEGQIWRHPSCEHNLRQIVTSALAYGPS